MSQPKLQVEGLSVRFPVRSGPFQRRVGEVRAVENVSLEIASGGVFGIVGESGSGKTTLGRAVLGLVDTHAGRISFEGRPLVGPGRARRTADHRRMSLVFQDPFGSLNPRMTARQLIAEPARIAGTVRTRAEARDLVAAKLDLVGLRADMADRHPHEFSGGQRQRIGIARALAGAADFIVLDEPVSALDVSIQAQIVNLLSDLQQTLGLTFLFIAHDIAVVCQFAERIAVMYLGHVVELTDRRRLVENPLHPYTQSLLSAVPIPDPVRERARQLALVKGDIAASSADLSGCVFHPRCPLANERCRVEKPALMDTSDNRAVACHAVEEGRV